MRNIQKMKDLFRIICFYLLIAFTECNNPTGISNVNNKNTDTLIGCDSVLRGKNIIKKKLLVYKVDTSFFPFLDSIINAELKCPYYNKCMSGFSFSTLKQAVSYSIEISTANIYYYDYSESFGLFEYKGVKFICDSLSINLLLQKTTQSRILKYYNIDRSQMHPINDDRYSSWYFEYRNKKIKPKGSHHCYIPKNDK